MTSMYILKTDQPTTDRSRILENFERQWVHRIHFMFGSRPGFSGSANRMSLLPVGPNPRSQPSAVLYNFEWPYL